MEASCVPFPFLLFRYVVTASLMQWKLSRQYLQPKWCCVRACKEGSNNNIQHLSVPTAYFIMYFRTFLSCFSAPQRNSNFHQILKQVKNTDKCTSTEVQVKGSTPQPPLLGHRKHAGKAVSQSFILRKPILWLTVHYYSNSYKCFLRQVTIIPELVARD